MVQSYQQNECEQIEDYTDHEIEEYKRNYLMNQPDSDETEFSNIKSNYQAPDDDDLDAHVTQKPKKVSETAIPSEIAAKP